MKIQKNLKLKKLLDRLSGFDDNINGVFDSLDKEMANVTSRLKETITAKTLNEVNGEFKNLQNTFKPLLPAFATLKQAFTDKNIELEKLLDRKLTELSKLVAEAQDNPQIDSLIKDVAELSQRKIEIPDFAKQINTVESKLLSTIESYKNQDILDDQEQYDKLQKQFADTEAAIKKLRIETLSRGGGSMNRKITFNGTDYLTRYTDINYKAGSNVTFTISNNNQTKQVDVTIAATGGSGSGIVRSVNSVSVDTAAGSSSTTDYVYLCSGTMTLTLPDATTNSNLYTVKNVGTGVVTIATTSLQTIDGQTTIQMATQFTSVDLISDTANWSIT